MTNKEAIEQLRERLAITDYRQQIPEYYEAIELAVEALGKQMPKRPDYEGDGYADGELVYDTWICPNCGKYYEVDYDNYKYCPECGQAIDLEW